MCGEFQFTLEPTLKVGGHSARFQALPTLPNSPNTVMQSGGIRSLINSPAIQSPFGFPLNHYCLRCPVEVARRNHLDLIVLNVASACLTLDLLLDFD